MSFTITSYYAYIQQTQFQKKNLPKPLQMGWDFIDRITNSGSSKNHYNTNEKVKRSIDLYLQKFSAFIEFSKTKAIVDQSKPKINLANNSIVIKKKTSSENENSIALKFIKSVLNMHGNVKSGRQIRLFIGRLQKAIETKAITQKSIYANEIMEIQKSLIGFYDRFDNDRQLEPVVFKKETRVRLRKIIQKIPVPISGINPKKLPDYLDIEEVTAGFGEGTKSASDNRFMMSSEDLLKVNFRHIGLKGKWLSLIGDPETGFRIAIFGAPKMGKSYLMIEFAGYLAANHGKVLYVAKEEGKSATLKKKLRDTASTHPRFMVSNYIPENLNDFDFCFFDSVTKLALTPKNLIAINAAFPKTSIVEVHQVTKDGKARGFNDFIHDVDGVIEIYEKGKATQYGRFNQGGELDFFDAKAS